MTGLGARVGIGRTSEVFRFGRRDVVKLLRADVPSHWAEIEAGYTEAVHAIGIPTPVVKDVIALGDRSGIVFERVDGPSMWSRMLEARGAAIALARELAAVHALLSAQPAPSVLPNLTERIGRKISEVGALNEDERGDALRLVAGLDNGARLYHGDLHPGNIVMSASGPVVIDWFDAAGGVSLADVVRTSLLLRPPGGTGAGPLHLPGATPELLDVVRREYLRSVLDGQTVSLPAVRSWEAVMAASRLAEGAERNEVELAGLWRDRRRSGASALVDELCRLGIVSP